MSRSSRICIALLVFLRAHGASLPERIEDLRNHSSVVGRAHLGYKFVDLGSGQVIAATDSASFFTPASNTKLYTTACALVRLGPDYRFRTEVRTSGEWQNGQAELKDLILVGGGDPNLSGRAMPYTVGEADTDPLRALNELADQLWKAGVRKVDGDVEAAAARYAGDPYPDGWTLDDSIYGYGAPVSALTLNDNTVTLVMRPTGTGELADIELQPGTSYFVLSNQVVTVPGGEVHIDVTRPGTQNELVLRGSIGQDVDAWREDVGVDSPPLWAAEQFANALRARGITVLGSAGIREDSCACAAVATHESPPLGQIIQVVNKVSQNLHAEMLLREIAVARGQPGTLQAGLKERQAFLDEAGVRSQDIALGDGSGLARQNLTSPDATVALLRYMWNRPEREVWLQSLPVGGFDGSLQKRFHQIAGAQRLHAKTGSLSHVSALSGYLEKRSGGWVAFSVMLNGANGRDKELRTFLDDLCALILDL